MTVGQGSVPAERSTRGSEGVDRFVESNTACWSDFTDGVTSGHGSVLVDITTTGPKYLQHHSALANYLGNELGLDPVYLLNEPDEETQTLCSSYGSDEFAILDHKRLDPTVLSKTVVDILSAYREIDSVEAFLSYEYDGVHIGDLAYNTAMRNTGHGTFEELGRPLWHRLASAMLLKRHTDRIIEEHDVEAFVLGHFYFNRCGVVARTAAANGVDVYAVKGRRSKTVRKYESPDELTRDPLRPTEEEVDFVWNEMREEAVEEAERLLSDRFGGVSSSTTGNPEEDPFDPNKTQLDEAEFYDRFDLDPAKPTAVVMAQIFVEPTTSDRSLFKDYVCWFRETIEHVATDESVNWLVKPHPHEPRYNCKQTVSGEVSRVTDTLEDHSITVLPKGLHTGSLLDVADAVVTMNGTAGLEFPCFGVPAILAGRSNYSAYGFTNDPASKTEYFDYLDSVETLNELDDTVRQRAKTVFYIEYFLMSVEMGLVPEDMDPAQTSKGEVFDEAARLVSQTDPSETDYYRSLQRFLDVDRGHLLDTTLMKNE